MKTLPANLRMAILTEEGLENIIDYVPDNSKGNKESIDNIETKVSDSLICWTLKLYTSLICNLWINGV